MTSCPFHLLRIVAILFVVFACFAAYRAVARAHENVVKEFTNPPDVAKPGVYWFFLDGNLSKEGMRADLDAIKNAGMGRALMMEAEQGGPRGDVSYLSQEWLDCWRDASQHAEKLGIDLAANVGPGWCGAGGPWIDPEHSMQHLRASETRVEGGRTLELQLPVPTPRDPYFGQGSLGPCRDAWLNFYRDVAVIAFPTPKSDLKLQDWEEKALFYRPPYSSMPGVKPYLPPLTDDEDVAKYDDAIIPFDSIVDLSDKTSEDGTLRWDAPEGNWTILRLGRRLTGQTTRPAPAAGLGLECDKFEPTGIEEHFRAFTDKLLDVANFSTLHHDSWEMSSQNWSEHFRDLFTEIRGYDPIPWTPAFFGFVVGSVEETERFLWDLRTTAQLLVYLCNVQRMKELADERGLLFSTEAYDLNPAGDLFLFSAADVPMCEFWSDGYGFDSRFSVFEAVSSAHTCGQPIVAAESFTTHRDQWRQFPGLAKRQGDWAYCAGVNRFLFHRMCSQPNDDAPGLSLGPHGMHFDRTQTWFPLLGGRHGYAEYLTRVQSMLQRGAPSADVLLLDLETAPCVYVAPESAFQKTPYKDKDRWNFDGCHPEVLIANAKAKDRKLVFPSGASYSLLVLPQTNEMTLELAKKLLQFKNAGVPMIGAKPRRVPGLMNHEENDAKLAKLVDKIWSGDNAPITPVYKPRTVAAESYEALLDSQWIWAGEWLQTPVGTVETFIKTVQAPKDVERALIFVAADNECEVFVNGVKVGGSDNFRVPATLDLAPQLREGDNEIAVRVTNGGDAPNPSGLIATIMINDQATRTDATWRAQDAAGAPLETSALGGFGMAPWNLRYERSFDRDATYPDWSVVESRLAALKIAPDFESRGYRLSQGGDPSAPSATLTRWIHKRVGNFDLYFVANVTEEPILVDCDFRVSGKQAQLWDPLTGRRYALDAAVPTPDDPTRTRVNLSFAPSQSWFVVFTPDAKDTKALPSASELFRGPQELFSLDLSRDWDATFNQNAAANRDFDKGQEKTIHFDALQDWSKSDDAYLKYYSGLAVYRKTFDAPEEGLAAPYAALLFDDVAVMAKVELNGVELATLWTTPWRAELPQGLLKTTGNELKITVANLWCNRLIGDASLPEEERFTRSSNPMWGPGDDQLQPSGLLGGVRLTFGAPANGENAR